jgi:hypothetical protein
MNRFPINLKHQKLQNWMINWKILQWNIFILKWRHEKIFFERLQLPPSSFLHLLRGCSQRTSCNICLERSHLLHPPKDVLCEQPLLDILLCQAGMTKDRDEALISIGPPFGIVILLNLWLLSEFVWGNLKIYCVIDSEDTICIERRFDRKIGFSWRIPFFNRPCVKFWFYSGFGYRWLFFEYRIPDTWTRKNLKYNVSAPQILCSKFDRSSKNGIWNSRS